MSVGQQLSVGFLALGHTFASIAVQDCSFSTEEHINTLIRNFASAVFFTAGLSCATLSASSRPSILSDAISLSASSVLVIGSFGASFYYSHPKDMQEGAIWTVSSLSLQHIPRFLWKVKETLKSVAEEQPLLPLYAYD